MVQNFDMKSMSAYKSQIEPIDLHRNVIEYFTFFYLILRSEWQTFRNSNS